MLAELFIDNFVIIKNEHIFFQEGFNVITGETGSGKSLLLKAINLILGQRADKNSIGKFNEKTIIEAVFILDETSIEKLKDMDITFEDDKLIITRTISKSSTTIRINSRLSNLLTLSKIAPYLIDTYNQGDSYSFMNKHYYEKLIDSYSNDKMSIKLRKKLNELFDSKDKITEKFQALDLSDEQIAREMDLLTYQIEEIDEIDLFNLDEEEIDRDYKKLEKATEIKMSLEKTKEILDSSNYNFISISNLLSESISNVDNFKSIDDDLTSIYDSLILVDEQVSDIYKNIDLYSQSLDEDPERLENLENLNKKIFSLKRKYGKDIDQIKTFYEKSKARLDDLSKISELKLTYTKQINELDQQIIDLSDNLSQIRKKKSLEIEKNINKEIIDLNIKNGKFKIDILRKDKASREGIDNISFLIKTNKGDSFKPMEKTASGGEISRIMLAFKSVFSEDSSANTLIFDEIDQGISGRSAQVVGEKILDISKEKQVISISHLPQIASLADRHILISKHDEDKFSESTAIILDEDGRINELSRLIGGAYITKTTEHSAKEMLKMAEDLRNDRR